MASLTIRKLDDGVKARLRVRAAEHGRSMEEEARTILETAVRTRGAEKPRNLYDAIRDCMAEAGIQGIELEIPPRSSSGREPVDFSGSEYGMYDDEGR